MSKELGSSESQPTTIDTITPSSITLTTRTERTWQTLFLHGFLRLFRNHLGRPIKKWPAESPRLKAPFLIKRKCNVEERKVDGIWVYDITLKDRTLACNPNRGNAGREKTRLSARRPQRIYYFAGGGWQSPPSGSHWHFLHHMLQEMHPISTISLVSYPLAPKSPAPVTLPLLMKLYHTVLREAVEKGERVTFAGDSSGGGIVLCLPLEALKENPNALHPHSIMAICPSTDMSRSNSQIKENEKNDPILKVNFIKSTAHRWAGNWDPNDPRISPLLSDHLDVFKKAKIKVDGCTAGFDVLGPDGVLFREKIARLGVEGSWLHGEQMMHVWPLVSMYKISPEANEGFLWITQILRRRGEEEAAAAAVAEHAVEGTIALPKEDIEMEKD